MDDPLKLRSVFRASLCVLGALALSSCAGAAWQEFFFPHNLPRHAAFNEAEFTNSLRSGTGVVRGQVFLNWNDGSGSFTAANTKVKLMPVTSYTTEAIQRKYKNGAYLAKPDPRVLKYIRTMQTDGDGNFQFSHVPAGHYYVGVKFTFLADDSYEDADGNYQEVHDNHYRQLYAEISVKEGQTVTIDSWSAGPERVP